MKYHSNLLDAEVYPQEELVFFYGGCLSQWADGIFYCHSLDETVNCAEQAMMLHKAKMFGDAETYNKIMRARHPSTQKALGKIVKGFDEEKWSTIKFECVKNINIDKFTSAPEWKELLFLTHPYELVEASPSDRIWGIGMDIDNPDLLNQFKWGMNLLGKALTMARDELMNKL